MSNLVQMMKPPSYGFERDGALYVPSHRELFAEFFSNYNIFKDKKNWFTFVSWTMTFLLIIPFLIFMTQYFTWPLFFGGLAYSMIILGTHGTIFLHRYSTHRAFEFAGPISRLIVRNLTPKIIPEEVYVISHHVHHAFSEKPGDPYNVYGGWLYCFLSDANHQSIAKGLTPTEYKRLTHFMEHTGVKINSYEQYQKWGSISHPARTVAHYLLNWAFWYGAFYLIGGQPFAMAMFGMSVIWAFGVRTFNYDGHGGGKDKRQVGIDFNTDDIAINQMWPGYVAGEWHSNHHLFARSARSGFLPYQLDLAWLFILGCSKIGMVKSYRDDRKNFLTQYYEPYQASLENQMSIKSPANQKASRFSN